MEISIQCDLCRNFLIIYGICLQKNGGKQAINILCFVFLGEITVQHLCSQNIIIFVRIDAEMRLRERVQKQRQVILKI